MSKRVTVRCSTNKLNTPFVLGRLQRLLATKLELALRETSQSEVAENRHCCGCPVFERIQRNDERLKQRPPTSREIPRDVQFNWTDMDSSVPAHSSAESSRRSAREFRN